MDGKTGCSEAGWAAGLEMLEEVRGHRRDRELSGPLSVRTEGSVGTHLVSNPCRTHIDERQLDGADAKTGLPTCSFHLKAKQLVLSKEEVWKE